MTKQTRTLFAWAVHLFTSLGLLSGFLALIAIGDGAWSLAFIWLFVSFLIDGVDGTLARYFRVEEVLPGMNGKNIDYVIDFATYAIIPAYFFYRAEMAPPDWMYPCLALILLSSALYYGKEGMVADGQYFVGFPVLWNLVVFYQFFVFHNIPWLNVVLVIVLSILHFVPIKYAYPSRSKGLFWLHLIASALWFICAGVSLFVLPERVLLIDILLIGIAIYFTVVAIWDTWGKKQISEK